jgi:hypothetical protein
VSHRARRRPTYRAVIWAGVVACLVGLVVTLHHGVTREDALVAAAFAGLIFVGELARVSLVGDRQCAPIALAAGLGYALIFSMGMEPASSTVANVLAVQGLAVGFAALLHWLAGRAANAHVLARQLFATASASLVFHQLVSRVGLGPEPAQSHALVPIMVASVAFAAMLDLLFGSAHYALHNGSGFKATLRDQTRATAGLLAAASATGVLIALSAHLMGWWALPVLVLPLLTTQFSFRRYAQIRSTYRQTIRALSKITEVGGYVQDGHSIRVSALAVATGRELGLAEGDLLDLEYAALMHDIGQLSLAEPIPRGSTLTVPAAERARIAAMGAEIIRSSGTLDNVAVIVERQADPYRRTRRPSDDTLPVASRIIKAASAYDDLVSVAPEDPRCRADALERLRLGMAYEYDPGVVEALARVVSRSSSSARTTSL